MKKVVKIDGSFGNVVKYVLCDIYQDFGIYEEITPSGYPKHQSWLISNDEIMIVIESHNEQCYMEVEQMIDDYNDCGVFGIKAGRTKYGWYYMHSNGSLNI